MKILKMLLYNLKWFGVGLSVIYGLYFVESVTDGYGVSDNEEFVMYTFWTSLIITIMLFYYRRKWIEICNKIFEYINNKL